jgi:hypothetical protein
MIPTGRTLMPRITWVAGLPGWHRDLVERLSSRRAST